MRRPPVLTLAVVYQAQRPVCNRGCNRENEQSPCNAGASYEFNWYSGDWVRGWTTTQAGLVTVASFRTWPGWRGACPRQPLRG